MTKKLSVCMIVKDEEKNIQRCLDSINTLIENESVELIIVDTGSKDKTIDLIRSYNANIYLHEWNGNFSDMRNISISYAKGEWIFILDADEVVENPNDVLKLLDDKRLKKFNTIRIQEKNLLTSQGDKYAYLIQDRFFRNDGTFHYSGSVHNQPVCKPPVLMSPVHLTHYGYFNDDKELMNKKFDRTASILKQELMNDPGNIYYQFQLARSYLAKGDYFTGLLEMKKAYDILIIKPLHERKSLFYVYVEYPKVLLHVKLHDKVIEICNEGLNLNDECLDLYYYKGHSQLDTGSSTDGIETLETYLLKYEKYSRNEKKLLDMNLLEIYTLDETAYEKTLFSILTTAKRDRVILSNYDSYLDRVKKLTNVKKRMFLHLSLRLMFIDIQGIVKDYSLLNNKEKIHFINILEEQLNDFDENLKMKIIKAFASTNDGYGLINEYRLNPKNSFLLSKLINEYDVIKYKDSIIVEVVEQLFKHKLSKRLFKKLEKSTIRKIILKLLDKGIEISQFEEFLLNDFNFNDYQNNRIFLSIANVILLSEIDRLKGKITNSKVDLFHIFNQYLEKGNHYIEFAYNIDKIRLIYNSHENMDERFLMIMYLFSSYLDKSNYSMALKYIKEAGEAYPSFAPFLSLTVKELRVKMQVLETKKTLEEVNKSDEKLKVIHGTMEIANQINTIVKAQNQLDHVAALGINYYPSYLSYGNSNIVDINEVKDKIKVTKDITDLAIDTFDVFHFHYGTSLMQGLSDIPLLIERNKKVFMHHWGTDVRRLSIAKTLNMFAKSKVENENEIIERLEYFGKYINDCIVADIELHEYVKEFYNKVHIVRQALDLGSYIQKDNFEFRKERPIIVHAPTSTDFKGTRYINAAIESLELKYNIEYKLVQNMSHDAAKEIYQNADIIIDQLHSSGHGLLSLEGMAMGKPVICSVSEFMKDFYPKDLPLVPANPKNIKEQLEKLIKDFELRKVLGEKGRKYVENYHDHNLIAKQLIEIYLS